MRCTPSRPTRTIRRPKSKQPARHRRLFLEALEERRVLDNQPPQITVPMPFGAPEDILSSVPGIVISDPDAGSGDIEVKVNVAAGQFAATPVGAAAVTGNNSGNLIVLGSLADINATLNTLTYLSALNDNGAKTFSVVANDQGNTGGPPQQTTHSGSFNVSARNDAPATIVPGPFSTPLNTFLDFGGIGVSDIDDDGTNIIQVKLAATGGLLSLLGNTTGLEGILDDFTFPIDGLNDPVIALVGPLAAINTALASNVRFIPTPGFVGPASIFVETNDLGNGGIGGALLDLDTIAITVVGPPPDPNQVFHTGAGHDQIVLKRVGANLVATLGAATLLDAQFSLINSITIHGEGGNDQLTVDLSGGNPIPAGGIQFHGGTQTGIPGDSLTVTGGTTTSVTHTFVSASDGSVTLAGGLAGTITYTGLEPVIDTIIAGNRSFVFTGGAETITLSDAAGANMTIDSTLGESVTFANPTVSLTIDAGTGSDTVTIASVDADGPFGSALTINGGTGDDTVNLNADINFAAGNSLNVDLQDDDATPGIDAINVGADANLVLAGSGAATLKSSRNIVLAAGSSIVTASGAVVLEANQQATPTAAAFIGIAVGNATISSTSGSITLKGRGGVAPSSSNLYGVRLSGTSVVGGTTGLVNIQGTGGDGFSFNIGMLMSGGSVTSAGGNIEITGVGGTGTSSIQVGIQVETGNITAAGSGSISLLGTGGSGDVGIYGVRILNSTQVTTASGGIQIIGAAGGTAQQNVGVVIQTSTTVSAGGAGAVAISGTGGVGTDSHGIQATNSSITAASGGIVLNGTAPNSNSFGFFASGSSAVTTTANSPIAVNANSISISTTPSINAGANIVTLRPLTAGTAINLGGADAAGTLGLTDAELDRVTTGTLRIGDSTSGPITISGTINTANTSRMHLRTGGSVTGFAGLNLVESELAISAGGSVFGPSTHQNDAGTLAVAGGGTLSFRDVNSLTIGTVDSVSGITTPSGAVLLGAVNGLTVNEPVDADAGGFFLVLSGDEALLAINAPVSGTGFGQIEADKMEIQAPVQVPGGNIFISSEHTVDFDNLHLGSTTNSAVDTLELSAAEIGHITADFLRLGLDGFGGSGTATISAAISPANVSQLGLVGDSLGQIAFQAGGSLAAPVRVVLGGNGAVSSDATGVDVTTASAIFQVDGAIGSAASPLRLSVASLESTAGSSQFLHEADSTNIVSTGFGGVSAGTGTVHLVGGTFNLSASNTINNNTKVQVETGAALGISTFNDTISQLIINGGDVTGTTGVLTSMSTIDARSGNVSAILAGAVGLTKTTAGTLNLSGVNTYSGMTSVDNGRLNVFSPGSIGNVTVALAGTLGGTGTVGNVSGGGMIAPGASAGILSTGNVSLFSSAAFFEFEVNGSTPGSQHDQLNVTGSIAAAISVGLNASGTITSSPGQQIVLVNNDGNDPVGFVFTSRPEGSFVTINGVNFRLTYVGGDGNDVVLIQNTGTTTVDVIGGNLLVTDVGSVTDDHLIVKLSGAFLRIHDPSNTLTTTSPGVIQVDLNTIAVPLAGITGHIQVNTLAGDDHLLLDYSGGALPPVNYDGGSQLAAPGDGLAIRAAGLGIVSTPNGGPAASPNFGTLQVTGAGLVSYQNIEPLDIDGGGGLVSIPLVGADDILTVQDGVDFATGLVAAIRVSGTSGGLGIETHAVRNAGELRIITTASDGNDTITLNTATGSGGAAVTSLTIDTGVGADMIDVNNAVTFAGGAVNLNSQQIDFNNLVSVITAGGLVTLNAGSGSITDGSIGTPSVVAPTLSAAAGTGITVGTNVNNLSAAVTAAGAINITEANAVTLTSV
ncbi:MAG: hypothetical protein L0228_05895, partial [Planctomycetes bacterium]|nr:hypothetical protein [Planctomycetota bacterium]